MKYGFIGCGNMGGAIARALVKKCTDFAITDRSGRAAALAAELNCKYSDNVTIAVQAKRIFLGVKPQMMESSFTYSEQYLQPTAPVTGLV